MTRSRKSYHQALDAVLERAASDIAFRAELLDHPREAIRQQFGIEIPPTFRMKFIERDPNVDALIVLPDANTSGELSDDDLDNVRGGTGESADAFEYTWSDDDVD
jgi:hypothetical protein